MRFQEELTLVVIMPEDDLLSSKAQDLSTKRPEYLNLIQVAD